MNSNKVDKKIILEKKPEIITTAHGSGGVTMQKFISEHIIRELRGLKTILPLEALDDSAVVDDIAFTIDGHTVKPLFFPGGDIGSLSVAGTVNDLLAIGAQPIGLALSLVIEEGFLIKDVDRIIQSIKKTGEEAKVNVVTGDTKTMGHGELDKCIITTAGIGKKHTYLDSNIKEVEKHRTFDSRWLLDSGLKEGDQLIISGYIADHGVAILSAREGYGFETKIESDVKPLTSLANIMLKSGGVVSLKDPTRGGLSNALHEWAQKSDKHIHIKEENIPIRDGTYSACEMLGIDPLMVGNEGKFLIGVVEEELDSLLKAINKSPLGKNAKHIGEVKKGKCKVSMETKIGGNRLVPPASGDLIPRIC
ncbi:MAG: hydrogenase expression/formation protein HypE [Candidatus Ranarchaeia archaeon]